MTGHSDATLDELAAAAGRLGHCDNLAELARTASDLATEVVPGVRGAGVVRMLHGERTMTLAETGRMDGENSREPVTLPVDTDTDNLVLRLAPDRPLDAGALRIARLFVAQLSAAVAVLHGRLRARNLERALENSREIGVAIGVIMSQRACTRQQALELLRRASRLRKRKLAGIATDVVEAGMREAGRRTGVDDRVRPGPATCARALPLP